MKQSKHQGGVWQYLEAKGVLELGSANIEQAKKEYWQAYRRRYNKEERTRYTITLTMKENEELLQAAKVHHRKPTTFLKLAAMAYLRQAFLVLNQTSVDEIRVLLSRAFCVLQNIEEADGIEVRNSVRPIVEQLEQDVLRCLANPPRIPSSSPSDRL